MSTLNLMGRNLLAITLLTLATMAFNVAWAHGDHVPEAPVTQQQVELRAAAVLEQLLDQNALAESWSKALLLTTNLQATPYGQMWVVHYKNSEENDAAKKDIYVFLDPVGNIVSANHRQALDVGIVMDTEFEILPGGAGIPAVKITHIKQQT
jgi:hypothetical protein